jgi:sugar phosphate isomerase/epimerase
MVVGGLPAASRDLAGARTRVADRLADLVPYAQELGVRLVLEPLHPMYAADRAVLSTLGQALDLAAPHPAEAVAVVVDTFHVFWDPALEDALARAGREGRIAAYQVCDFNLPIAADALLSRGMMGDGVIDFAAITGMVDATGYAGDIEVEIFNADVWAAPGDDVVATMRERFGKLVAPHLTR